MSLPFTASLSCSGTANASMLSLMAVVVFPMGLDYCNGTAHLATHKIAAAKALEAHLTGAVILLKQIAAYLSFIVQVYDVHLIIE